MERRGYEQLFDVTTEFNGFFTVPWSGDIIACGEGNNDLVQVFSKNGRKKFGQGDLESIHFAPTTNVCGLANQVLFLPGNRMIISGRFSDHPGAVMLDENYRIMRSFSEKISKLFCPSGVWQAALTNSGNIVLNRNDNKVMTVNAGGYLLGKKDGGYNLTVFPKGFIIASQRGSAQHDSEDYFTIGNSGTETLNDCDLFYKKILRKILRLSGTDNLFNPLFFDKIIKMSENSFLLFGEWQEIFSEDGSAISVPGFVKIDKEFNPDWDFHSKLVGDPSFTDKRFDLRLALALPEDKTFISLDNDFQIKGGQKMLILDKHGQYCARESEILNKRPEFRANGGAIECSQVSAAVYLPEVNGLLICESFLDTIHMGDDTRPVRYSRTGIYYLP